MAEYLSLDILTPEGRVNLRRADGESSSGDSGPIEVEGVELPAALGEMGVRARHIPFLTPLVPGVVRFRYEGDSRRLAVGTGFVEISADGVVTLLTERVVRAGEVDSGAVRQEHEAVVQALKERASAAFDDAEVVKLKQRRDWLDAQLRAAET